MAEENKIEPVKQIEIDTKDLVASSRIWIYLIIGLLVYMMFFIIPTIEEKVTWMEKDLNSVLVQSERFKRSTRVFAKDNQCASCHLNPDFLLHSLLTKYPSFIIASISRRFRMVNCASTSVELSWPRTYP